MSSAVKCDSCDSLVEAHKSIALEVRVPDQQNPNEYASWSDIDICSTCFNWTLSEVLRHACIGITLPKGDMPRLVERSRINPQGSKKAQIKIRMQRPDDLMPDCIEIISFDV